MKRSLRRRARGQGLVEYALILALVALVTLLIMGITGGSVQRIFGQIAAVFGQKMDSNDGTNYIIIDSNPAYRACYWGPLVPGWPATVTMYVQGTSNVDATHLVGTAEDGESTALSVNGAPPNFKWGNALQTAKCPVSVVIKSYPPDPNMIAFVPIKPYYYGP